jgi:prophage regulatory protein
MSRLIRRPEVVRLVGLSYSTVYRLERAGQFPSRRRIAQNCVGWDLAEIEAWIASRPTSSCREPWGPSGSGTGGTR